MIPLTLCFVQCKSITKKTVHPNLPKEVSIADARIVLQHFVHGSIPEYAAAPASSIALSAETLSQPDYCFAGCMDQTSHEHDPYICFQANTKAFLIPFAKGVKDSPITEKTYLNGEQTVEKWVYGNHWAVIVNFSGEDYLHQNVLLPPYGFVAVGPDFLAQHYYPHADDRAAMLFVQHHGKRFLAFQ